MNVGVLVEGLNEWDGGVDLLKAYIHPMARSTSLSVYVLFSKYSRELERDEKIKRWIIEGKLDATIVDYGYDWYDLCRKAKKLKLDVMFPVLRDLTENFPIPWVPYMPDFQHRYFPSFFTKSDIEYRNQDFGNKVAPKRAVMVEAESVKKDIMTFYPEAKAKIFVMPYTAIPEQEWLDVDNNDISEYNLPSRYFLISNQFWQHKDHATAFRALSLLEKENSDVCIVCTGNPNDNRNPEYYSSLLKIIDEAGIKDRVRFLGFIPKKDQIAIMCGALAVIQPTLFEGNPGGGIAYNAISMNVPIILSDIDVNKELKGDNVYFFKKSDYVDLAEKMNELADENCRYILDRDYLLTAAGKRFDELMVAIQKMLDYAVSENCEGFGSKTKTNYGIKRYLRAKLKTFTQMTGMYSIICGKRR